MRAGAQVSRIVHGEDGTRGASPYVGQGTLACFHFAEANVSYGMNELHFEAKSPGPSLDPTRA